MEEEEETGSPSVSRFGSRQMCQVMNRAVAREFLTDIVGIVYHVLLCEPAT